ncbi:MAG TPA: hypothetical protein VF066_12220 [Thermoleophilaceae bacterium]
MAASIPAPGADGASCVYPSAYPGDNAAKATVAAWMAGAAGDAGLPGELPVMAALVDSGLKNLPQGDSTTAGYFQIRVDIWNKGDYAGFPDHPTLQLQWFIDQAQAMRQRAIAAGNVAYGRDPSTWGMWAADVQRPAEQYRGRYQLRLEDARALIASGCAAPDPAAPPSDPAPSEPGSPPPRDPDAQLIPDSLLPRLALQARRHQDAGRSGALAVTAACSNERCLMRVAASVAVPGRAIFRMSAPPVQIGRGERRTFQLKLSSRLRRLAVTSARKKACPLAAIRVVAANAGGYRSSASRTVVVGRAALCGP